MDALPMKIRHLLFVLTGLLGFGLVAAVAIHITREAADYVAAQRMNASNNVREQLLLAGIAITNERTLSYVQLITTIDTAPSPEIARLRQQSERSLRAAATAIEHHRSTLPEAAPSIEVLSQVHREMHSLRDDVDAALLTLDRAARADTAQRWFDRTTSSVDVLQETRMSELHRNWPLEPALRSEANIRAMGDVLQEAISDNEAILASLLLSAAPNRHSAGEEIVRNVGQMELAWKLIDYELKSPISAAVRSAITTVRNDYRGSYRLVQTQLMNSLLNDAPIGVTLANWSMQSGRILSGIDMMQAKLLASSRDGAQTELDVKTRTVALLSLLVGLGVLAVVISTFAVKNRVVDPLGRLSEAMLRLAHNDLTISVPRARQADEVGEMVNALRTFKANALLRERTDAAVAKLNLKLQAAYDQLHKDLQAASIIQAAMLPPPGQFGSVHHEGVYAPSSHIAGDTYNVLELPGGSVGFLQIDVAGHGAGAALVSVASNQIISQALLTMPKSSRIEDIAYKVNQTWPENLPYFTMIYGEISSSAPSGRIVQAGHPCPIFIGAEGQANFLCDSGFPIGMYDGASYDSHEFRFGPGDRILLYSDGVVEAENRAGELYSDQRFLELVANSAHLPTRQLLELIQHSLHDWRGCDALTDDVSVLVLERNMDWTVEHANH